MKNDKKISERMEELEQKLQWFNGNEFTLDEAAERYAKVERLVAEAETVLREAQNRVEIIKKKFD